MPIAAKKKKRQELKDQDDIIATIRAEGGYAEKWASLFQVGKPDLICALPGVGNFLMEVKVKDEEPRLKQDYELKQNDDGGGLSLIGHVVRRNTLSLTAKHAPTVYQEVYWDQRTKTYRGMKGVINAWLKK